MKKTVVAGIVVALVCTVAFVGAPAYAGQHRVSVCHVRGNGDFHMITIASRAYDAHIAHGDFDVITLFEDWDGDGFGFGESVGIACEVAEGYSDNDLDCDDNDATSYPGAWEDCGDGVDSNCDGSADDWHVDLREACSAGSSVFQTICAYGDVPVDPARIGTGAGTSYISVGADVESVILHHCDGRTLEIFGNQNLCSLPGGCCSAGRWNDEICSVEVNP